MSNPGGRLPRAVTPPETRIIDHEDRIRILERLRTTGGDGGGSGGQLLGGTGPPGAGLGNAGDWYMDTRSSVLYGPKTSGWDAGTYIGSSKSLVFSTATATLAASATYRCMEALTLTIGYLWSEGPPIGSPLTVQILVNSTVIATLSKQVNSPSEVSGLLNYPCVAGDRIKVRPTSVGSGSPATNVSVQIEISGVAQGIETETRVAVPLGVVLYNGVAYPPRPDYLVVEWIGPIEPPSDIQDFGDIWIPTIPTFVGNPSLFNDKGVSIHNGTAYPPRLSGFGSVEWIGPVPPGVLALPGDTWAPMTVAVTGNTVNDQKGVALFINGLYPERTDDFASVLWIGPVNPGSLAISGDTWVPTS